MVTFFGFFQVMQVRFQFFFCRKSRSVDSCQLLVPDVTPPIGSGDGHQLEVTDFRRIFHVRSTAQIDEEVVARFLLVETHFIAFWNSLQQF